MEKLKTYLKFIYLFCCNIKRKYSISLRNNTIIYKNKGKEILRVIPYSEAIK